jgi:hypothetical protein
VRRVLDLSEHAKNGRWPLGGGLVDQAAVFVEACELIWDMRRQYQR